MNFKKGQPVLAKDINGKRHPMRVWSEAKHSVFVASDRLFAALKRGDTAQWPVAVPKQDVSFDDTRFK